MDEIYTSKEVCERLKITRRTLMTWLKEGRIEGTQLPTGAWRFNEAQVSAVLKKEKTELPEILKEIKDKTDLNEKSQEDINDILRGLK